MQENDLYRQRQNGQKDQFRGITNENNANQNVVNLFLSIVSVY